MQNFKSSKGFDLEDRCLEFAKNCKNLIKLLSNSPTNLVYCRQLARSSSSIGANYIEANEMLSKKDFVLRAKIAKKESREARYWLNLIDVPEALEADRQALIKESTELMHILGAIIEKMK